MPANTIAHAVSSPVEKANTWTVRQVIAWASGDFDRLGFSSPRLDAELVVAFALGLDRVGLYMDLDRPLSHDERATIRTLVMRRRAYEPVAYILGEKEFYGRMFEVDRSVLIPRPDTETLVECALGVIPKGDRVTALDLCTGSGAVAVTLTAERPQASFVATDISAPALRMAKKNAERHSVADRIQWLEGDLFEPMQADKTFHDAFDVIVANPPYLDIAESDDLSRDIRDYEPYLALFAADRGLAVALRLLKNAPLFLKKTGALFMEVGYGQASKILENAELSGMFELRAHKDLGGVERVIEARLKS